MTQKIIIKPKFIFKKGIRTAKENTGTFYCYLYAKLFGGRIIKKKKGETFTPDIIKETETEKMYTEVKSIATETSQTMCDVKQFQNYLDYSVRDMLNTDKTITTNYAFFRYAHGPNSGKTSEMNIDELRTELCKRTKSVLITPLNLMSIILLNSHEMDVNRYPSSAQEINPNKRKYWRVPGQIIQGLHDSPFETLKELREGCGYSRDTLQDVFTVTHLDYERSFIDNAYCGKIRISPITVTRFFNRDKDLFEERTKREYKRILKNILKFK